MDPQKLDGFECIDSVNFLRSQDFGAVLRRHKGGEGRAFRDQCLKFVDRFVCVILGQQPVTGDFSQGVYAFCPELLLEGDDHHMTDLFRKLVRVLERCGVVSSLESKSAVEEYASFVVDARARHAGSNSCAEAIDDVRQYLLDDYGFLARKSLCRVFKLCCLVVLKPRVDFPAVDIGLSDCRVPERVVATCIRGVQSSVMSPGFKLGSFFTKFTMGEVRKSIAAASSFMTAADFNPWEGICGENQSAFVDRYRDLFNKQVSRKRGGVIGQSLGVGTSSRDAAAVDGEGCSSQCESLTASTVCAPADSATSTCSPFGLSKVQVHLSIASLLGRKRDAEEVGESSSKKDKKKSRQSVVKDDESRSKKK